VHMWNLWIVRYMPICSFFVCRTLPARWRSWLGRGFVLTTIKGAGRVSPGSPGAPFLLCFFTSRLWSQVELLHLTAANCLNEISDDYPTGIFPVTLQIHHSRHQPRILIILFFPNHHLIWLYIFAFSDMRMAYTRNKICGIWARIFIFAWGQMTFRSSFLGTRLPLQCLFVTLYFMSDLFVNILPHLFRV
jgi:hypothetical protein